MEVVKEFKAENLRVVTQTNQGAAAARNMALSLSSGDYIQWLDADDILDHDKIRVQLDSIGENANPHTLLSGAWGTFTYDPSRAEFHSTRLWADLSPVEWLTRKLGENLFMQTATWLVSRELTVAAGPWDTRQLSDDDGEYFCRVILASSGIQFVPEAKVYYRVSGGGTLCYIGQSHKKMEALWASMQAHVRYIRSLEDTESVRNACLKYLQVCSIYFYEIRPDIFSQAEQLATELGGELAAPKLSWKYRWIQKLFGWGLARRTQIALPNAKLSARLLWERMLFRLSWR